MRPLLCLGLLLASPLRVVAEPSCPLPGYAYVWGDEFDGVKLDEDRWEPHVGQRGPGRRLKQNVMLRDGQLVLTGRNGGGSAYLPFSTGEVSSRRLFRYGYYEARLRVPGVRGWQTLFCAADARNDGARLGILDNDSLWPDRYLSQLCWGDPSSLTSTLVSLDKQVKASGLSENFHIWGCEFTSERVRFFFEGRPVAVADVRSFQHGDLRVWLKVGVSFNPGYLGGTEAATVEVAGHRIHAEVVSPAEASFDYVRVFVRK